MVEVLGVLYEGWAEEEGGGGLSSESLLKTKIDICEIYKKKLSKYFFNRLGACHKRRI